MQGLSEQATSLLMEAKLTKHPGKGGLAGVSNGKLTHFRPLWGAS